MNSKRIHASQVKNRCYEPNLNFFRKGSCAIIFINKNTAIKLFSLLQKSIYRTKFISAKQNQKNFTMHPINFKRLLRILHSFQYAPYIFFFLDNFLQFLYFKAASIIFSIIILKVLNFIEKKR